MKAVACLLQKAALERENAALREILQAIEPMQEVSWCRLQSCSNMAVYGSRAHPITLLDVNPVQALPDSGFSKKQG